MTMPANLALPSGWSGYTPQQKMAFYTGNGITSDDLAGIGVPASELTYLKSLGFESAAPVNQFAGTQVRANDGTVYNYDDILKQVDTRLGEGKNMALGAKAALQLGLPTDVIMSLPGMTQADFDAGQKLISSGAFDAKAEGTGAQAAAVGTPTYNARIAAGLDAYGYPQAQVKMMKAAGTYVEPPASGTGTYAQPAGALTTATTAPKFDPVAMGLTPSYSTTGGVEQGNVESTLNSYSRDNGDGTFSAWDPQGNQIADHQKYKSAMDMAGEGLGTLAKTVAPFVLPMLAPGIGTWLGQATGLSGLPLSALTGATVGGLGAGATGGNILQGALLGGAGGALSNVVGDYLGNNTLDYNGGTGGNNLDTNPDLNGSVGDYTGLPAPYTQEQLPGFTQQPVADVPINIAENPGPLSRTQLDMTTDTAGAAANALDVTKFNQALDMGASVTDAVNYATDANTTTLNTNPTDTRLSNNTQLPAGTNDVTGGLTTLGDSTETNRDVRGYDGEEIGGTGDTTSKAFPSGTVSVDTQPGVFDKVANTVKDAFTKPDGTTDWSKVLGAAGVVTSTLGKVTSGGPSGTPASIDDLWKSIGKTPPGGPTTPGAVGPVGGLSAFGQPFLAGNQLQRQYAADMTSPIRAGVGYSSYGSPSPAVTQPDVLRGALQSLSGQTPPSAAGSDITKQKAAYDFNAMLPKAPEASTGPYTEPTLPGGNYGRGQDFGGAGWVANPNAKTGRLGDQMTMDYQPAYIRDPNYGRAVEFNPEQQLSAQKVGGPSAEQLAMMNGLTSSIGYAEGGEVEGGLSLAAPFAGFVQGDGGGQDDNIDAKLSPGEYVFDAESVSMLGDGNNAEGARKLDELRQSLRAHKRSAPNSEIAPQAQGALSYMNGGQ